MALLTAIALTIFMVEAQISSPVPLPGVKLGTCQIRHGVCRVRNWGQKEAAMILAVRIFLGAVFSGNFVTILYSSSGVFLAILTTIGLRRLLTVRQL